MKTSMVKLQHQEISAQQELPRVLQQVCSLVVHKVPWLAAGAWLSPLFLAFAELLGPLGACASLGRFRQQQFLAKG
jgi:hypothetical protein